MAEPKLEYFNSIYLGSYTSSILYSVSCLKLLRCSCFIIPREETVMHVKTGASQGNYTYRKPQRISQKEPRSGILKISFAIALYIILYTLPYTKL